MTQGHDTKGERPAVGRFPESELSHAEVSSTGWRQAWPRLAALAFNPQAFGAMLTGAGDLWTARAAGHW
jgi:hypothetical protein